MKQVKAVCGRGEDEQFNVDKTTQAAQSHSYAVYVMVKVEGTTIRPKLKVGSYASRMEKKRFARYCIFL